MSHGHLAFYGAYVSLNLAFITYAMPKLLGREPYNQVLNMIAFWVMGAAMVFMTFALTFAGAVQTHLQRVRGENFMDVQDELYLFFVMREIAGLILVAGVALYLYSVFVPRSQEVISPAAKQPAE
jgi:nitric oxide reductase subunit B